MKAQIVIVLTLIFLLLSVATYASPDVESDSELEHAVNVAVAKSIATISVFDAKRCDIYSEVVLGQVRKVRGALSGEATAMSKHLDIWILKVSQLRAMPNFDAVTDEDVFNYSALGLITNAPADTPESVKVSTTELFAAEANRCSIMVSEAALVWVDAINEASE